MGEGGQAVGQSVAYRNCDLKIPYFNNGDEKSLTEGHLAVGHTVLAQGHGARPRRSKECFGYCLPENPPILIVGSVKEG